MAQEELIVLLDEFAGAWNRHDSDALVSMMTEDGVFETFAGPGPSGARHEGRDALRAAFSAVFEAFPDASWDDARHIVCGDRGFSEWTFRGTDRSGNGVEVRGVDIFTFRDGRIARKDTFRKARIK
jgi:steroid delta-isomerase-like uncharacterized protein